MRELIDNIIDDKIKRVEAALSAVHKNFASIVKADNAGLTQPAPGQEAANGSAQPTPEESSIIEKILNKIKDFTSKIQPQGGVATAATRVAMDDQAKEKHYQTFINWVKTNLKPYLENKQKDGVPIDKSKIINALKDRISSELPEWQDFLFKTLSEPSPSGAPGIVTSNFLFDERVLHASSPNLDKMVADILHQIGVYAAAPGSSEATIAQFLRGNPEFAKKVLSEAIDAKQGPLAKGYAATKVLNESISRKIDVVIQQQGRGLSEEDLPKLILNHTDKEVKASAAAFAQPLTQWIEITKREVSNQLRKSGQHIPADAIMESPSVQNLLKGVLVRAYKVDTFDAASIGERCLGTVAPSYSLPDGSLKALAVRAGEIVIAAAKPLLEPKTAPAPAEEPKAYMTLDKIYAVLDTYFDKFVYVASNLQSDCSVDELVYALTGNAPADPYTRLVSDFITYRIADTKKAEQLLEQIQPVIEQNPEMLKKFYNDYTENSAEKVQEFQSNTGLSDTIINSVLKDKLLDESSLKALRKNISDSVKNETENVDPEEKEEAAEQVEDFVEDSGVTPEMTAVVVNSEIDKVVRQLFSEVSIEDQLRIASSEESMQKIFSHIDSEVKKIDKRYSKANIMLLFDPEKGGFYTKEMSDISSDEKENIQGTAPTAPPANPIQPLDTPGDEELSFPTGNELGGGNAQPGAAAPATPQPDSAASEFEKALQ